MRRTPLVLALAVLIAWVDAATASMIYSVNYRKTRGENPNVTLESNSPGLTTQGSFEDKNAEETVVFWSGNWFAQANQGSLASSIFADHNSTFGTNSELGSYATLEYNDVIFSSDENTNINVTLPLHLSGSLTTTVVASRVIVEAKLDGQSRVGLYRPATNEAAGLLSGLTGGSIDTTLQASFTNIPTNTPVTLFLSLSTDMFINGNNTAFANFGSTYGFVTDGPTFIVPEGVTVDSELGGIVDNRFSPSSVPEPSSVVLLGLGSIVILPIRLRTRRKQSGTTVAA